MSPQNDPRAAAEAVRDLVGLTEALTQRLEGESRALAERRPGDLAASLPVTQEMANRYRRDSAQVKAAPGLVAAAPASDRMALIRATERFQTVLKAHERAVEAARTISEGIMQAIAGEVAASRAAGFGYGATGRAPAADGRAITLNRSA